MTTYSDLALSVRQPWAWAIIHAGKDIENRSWQAVNHGLRRRGTVMIHASLGMTQEEYRDASTFMKSIGVDCPAPSQLLRGGIIGSVDVVDVVSESESPWFFGPRGLVLANAKPIDFIGSYGALGYFTWKPNKSAPAASKPWMIKCDNAHPLLPEPHEMDMFSAPQGGKS